MNDIADRTESGVIASGVIGDEDASAAKAASTGTAVRRGRRGLARIAVILVAVVALGAVLAAYGVQPLLSALRQVDAGSLALAILALLANYAFALMRFRSVITRLGHGLRFRTALAGFAVGQLSNAFILNIVGQSLGRAAVLARDGVPVDASVIGTYFERLIATGVLGLLAVAGVFALFGGLGFQFTGGAAYLISVLFSLAVAALAVWRFCLRRSPEWRAALAGLPPPSLVWPAVAYTLLAQLSMGLAYWFLLPIPDGVSPLSVAAAIAVVMFLASIPISFAGWGIRELSAAKALGLLGIAPHFAVAAAVLVGLLSLLIPLLNAAAIALLARDLRSSPRNARADAAQVDHLDGARSLMLLIAFSTAILIGFQVRIPMEGYETTVNLGDAGALTSLGVAGYLAWRTLPVPVFDRSVAVTLLTLSAIIAGALLLGAARYGFIEWAWLNRGMGWLVVLGYVSLGAGTALVAGDGGRDKVLRAFLAAMLAIAVIQCLLYLLWIGGVGLHSNFNSPELKGFALNRNAFAIQLAMALIVVWLGAAQSSHLEKATWPWAFAAAALFTATFLTYSRTGWICAGALLVFAPLLAPSGARQAVAKTFIAGALMGIAYVVAVDYVFAVLVRAFSFPSFFEVWQTGREVSNAERWQTIADGLSLWMSHPVFGAGLGAYVHERLSAGLSFQVIHSVLVWLLAETGLFGFVAAVGATLWMTFSLWSRSHQGRDGLYARAAIIAVAVFVLYGLVHDTFVQRSFWLLFGLFAALAPRGRGNGCAASPA